MIDIRDFCEGGPRTVRGREYPAWEDIADAQESAARPINLAVTEAWNLVTENFLVLADEHPMETADWNGWRDLSERCGVTVAIPEGDYLIDRTLVLPPMVSLVGESPYTRLYFGPDPATDPGHMFLAETSNIMEPTHGKRICILRPSKLTLLGGPTIHDARSTVRDLNIYTRGNSVGVCCYGTANNQRLERIHLHGWSNQAGPHSSIGIARLSVHAPIDLGNGLWSATQPAEGAYNTDGVIDDVFCEHFGIGIYGNQGRNPRLSNINLGECKRGLHVFGENVLINGVQGSSIKDEASPMDIGIVINAKGFTIAAAQFSNYDLHISAVGQGSIDRRAGRIHETGWQAWIGGPNYGPTKIQIT